MPSYLLGTSPTHSAPQQVSALRPGVSLCQQVQIYPPHPRSLASGGREGAECMWEGSQKVKEGGGQTMPPVEKTPESWDYQALGAREKC